jgi:hypothetical protein
VLRKGWRGRRLGKGDWDERLPAPTPNPVREVHISWRRPGDPGDWDERLPAPAAMSGSAASLGLRSGSYGSLAATVAGSGDAGRKLAGGTRGWVACRG